jgi:hypothetical protein
MKFYRKTKRQKQKQKDKNKNKKTKTKTKRQKQTTKRQTTKPDPTFFYEYANHYMLLCRIQWFFRNPLHAPAVAFRG